jgi:RsiW-degrading membrane proteinase PrsW (M82 family)
LYYIYSKDTKKEPVGLFLKSFVWGCLIVFPVMGLEHTLSHMYESESPFLSSFYEAFVVAAFSEELCKFLCQYIIIWKRKEFDQYYDGIIYAVFVSLGFAMVENISYILHYGYSISLGRAIFAVPGHGLDGILMGYFFSLARFSPPPKQHKYLLLSIISPISAHGLYDFLLIYFGTGWYEDILSAGIAQIIFWTLFLILLLSLWHLSIRSIKKYVNRDKNIDGKGYDWKAIVLKLKKLKKPKKKTLFIILLIVMIVYVSITVFLRWNNRYGVRYSWKVSDNLTVIHYNNGDESIKENETGTIHKERYDKIFNTYSEIKRLSIVVVKNGLRGYVSAETGKMIIEPKYKKAWIDDPVSGLAACVNENGKLGFINVKTREFAIPFKFEPVNYKNFVFHNGKCIIYNEEEKAGIIDTSGVCEAFYDGLSYLNNGFYEVVKDDKTGILDSVLNIFLPVAYRKIEYDDPLYYLYEDSTITIMDNKRNVLNTIRYYSRENEIGEPFFEIACILIKQDEYDELIKSVVYGEKSQYSKYKSGNKFGIYDSQFNVVIPAQCDEIEYLGNGYFVLTNTGESNLFNVN